MGCVHPQIQYQSIDDPPGIYGAGANENSEGEGEEDEYYDGITDVVYRVVR